MSDTFFPLGSFGSAAMYFDNVHVDALRFGNAVCVMARKNLKRALGETGNFKDCGKPRDVVKEVREIVRESMEEVFEMLNVDRHEDVSLTTQRFFRHMGMMAVLRDGAVRRAMVGCAA